MEGLRKDSTFARLVARGLTEGFQLADVGCWGGIDEAWRLFGDRLQAVGFDCISEEIARLRAAETHPGVAYVDGFVGLPADHPLRRRIGTRPVWHNWAPYRLSYQRSVAIREARAAGLPPPSLIDHYRDRVWSQVGDGAPAGGFDTDYAAAFARFGPDDAQATDQLLLPAVLRDHGLTDLDFLKIDVDGPDYEVLRSATDLLAQPGLLAAGLEVCFYGSHDAGDNSFHNTDRLMREKGFELFALSVRQYSSAALPWPYMDTYPALTQGGRPVQGDAIYIRDLASPLRRAAAAAVTDEKLAKLAAVFALMNLPDEAAEVLLAHRDRLGAILDVDAGLNLLALQIQENDGGALSYAGYVAAFEAEEPQFLDVYGRRNTWLQGLIEAGRARDAALSRAAAAEAELARERAAREQAEARLAAMRPGVLDRLWRRRR